MAWQWDRSEGWTVHLSGDRSAVGERRQRGRRSGRERCERGGVSMSGMLADARLIAYMADGSKHEVRMKPRHVKQVQTRFRDEKPGEMEQTIYM